MNKTVQALWQLLGPEWVKSGEYLYRPDDAYGTWIRCVLDDALVVDFMKAGKRVPSKVLKYLMKEPVEAMADEIKKHLSTNSDIEAWLSKNQEHLGSAITYEAFFRKVFLTEAIEQELIESITDDSRTIFVDGKEINYRWVDGKCVVYENEADDGEAIEMEFGVAIKSLN